MNKVLILSFFILFWGINVSAQKQSTVQLKNGSIIYGKIIENHPDSIIKIKTNCENILVLNHSDIQNVEFSGNDEVKTPYNLSMNLGIAGFGGNHDAGISLMLSGTYNFKERYRAGILTGVEHFEIPLLPVAAEFQTDIFKRSTTPYIYLRGGYGFKLISNENNNDYTTEYKGGPMFGAGIGIKKRFSSEFAMTFSIGYRHQQSYEYRDYLFNDWWGSDYERHYFNNRAAFRIGLVF